MRKIDPYFDNPPTALREDATKKRSKTKNNPKGISKIQLALIEKAEYEFDREIYGSKRVKDTLRTIFYNKCGFCETNTHAGAHKDVEHYRFKKHYYWLGYEWSNLLVSCQICNRDFKGTKFPLENPEQQFKTPLLNSSGNLDENACDIRQMNLIERPLLLHPAIDDPAQHLQFLPNGSVEGITKKGHVSIDIYGLRRDSLQKARKKIIQQIRQEILQEYLVKDTLNDDELITEIRKAINHLKNRIKNNEEYTALAATILTNFDDFIIDNQDMEIDMPDKERIRTIAQELLSP
jgi:uncharacterized protein (TIGR02646 family)